LRTLVLLLVLAGCATPPRAPTVPIPLRNPTAPVASQIDVTQDRLAGDWIVVQGAGLPPGTRVTIGTDLLRTETPTQSKVSTFTPRGQGRYDTGDGPLWVHWIDVGNRTAALGDPSGSRVWIMDRAASGSPDRIRAAREILDWYGYDLMRMVGP